jgi:hypothetical protein
MPYLTVYVVAVQYTLLNIQRLHLSRTLPAGRVARENFLLQMRGTPLELPRQRHLAAVHRQTPYHLHHRTWVKGTS